MQKIFDLPAMTRRYSVSSDTILDWSLQGFIPAPAFIAGQLYWCGPSVEAHDCITGASGGQPTLEKNWFYDVEAA